MQNRFQRFWISLLFIFLITPPLWAADLTIPYSFTNGTTIDANAMNTNFTTVKTGHDAQEDLLDGTTPFSNNLKIKKSSAAFTTDSNTGSNASFTLQENAVDKGFLQWNSVGTKLVLQNATINNKFELFDTGTVVLTSTNAQDITLTSAGNVNISANELEMGGTSVLTNSRVLQNITQATVDNIGLNGNTVSTSSGDLSLTPVVNVDITAGSLKMAGIARLTTGGVATLSAGSTVGTLTFSNGSIVDSSGTISFDNENLLTTGSFTAATLGGALNANNQAITNVNIDSGAIDGTTVGASSAAAITGTTITGTSLVNSSWSGSKALYSNAGKTITESSVTSTELGYLSGATSSIQGQLWSRSIASNGSSSGVADFISVAYSDLASGGTVTLIPALSGHKFNIHSINAYFNTAFSGGGGDRSIEITDGTTVWSLVPFAQLTAGSNIRRWGDTGLPNPSSVAAFRTSGATNTAIYAIYSGGTTDYSSAGLIRFRILGRYE